MKSQYTLDQIVGVQFTSAKSERDIHAPVHRHIARYIRPQLAEFFTEGRQTDKRPAIEILWDDTALNANDALARGINSMTHNQATDWFLFKDEQEEINQDVEAAQWYSKVNKDLKKQLKESGFYAAALHRLKDNTAFGFASIYSYEDDNKGNMAFEYISAPESYFTLYRDGTCRTFLRPLDLTAIQLEERGITISKCSTEVQQAFKDKNQSTRFLFLHYVAPVGDLPETVKSNHDFVGVYYETAQSKVIDQHGFFDMPYHVLTWDPIPQSPYPTGIGYMTLPEIRTLNAQRKKMDRIVDNESDSPILTTSQDEGKEQSRPQSGEQVYGGMSGDGKRLYDPLYKGATGSRIMQEENKASRAIVLEAFHNNLMLMLSRSQMTAQEVASRDEKIIQAMGPFIIPMMKDLQTILDRLFHSRMRAGAYDPLPAVFDKETKMMLELQGILAKAHMKLTAGNITQFYGEALATIGQVAPEVVASLNHNESLKHLGQARALPEGIIPTDQEREEREARDLEAQQRQQQIEAAPALAKAAKDAAGAATELGIDPGQLAGQGGGQGGVQLAP